MIYVSRSIAVVIALVGTMTLAGCVPEPSSAPATTSTGTPESVASAPPTQSPPSASALPESTPPSDAEAVAAAIADGQDSCNMVAALAEDVATVQDALAVDATGETVDSDVLQRIQDGLDQSSAVAGPIVKPYVDAESVTFAALRAGIEQGDVDAIQASGFTDATVAMTFYCLNNLDADPS